MKPDVSIIVPVYNAAPYLDRCLESVLSQTFDGPMEVVLVDDGSEDGSGDICDRYAARYPSVRVFHTENRGASLARRLGLERSEGENVTFVDSDDYVAREYVELLLGMAREFGCALSGCGVRRILPGRRPSPEAGVYRPGVLTFEELMPRFFKYEFWGFCGKLYRRSHLKAIPFPEATVSEDYCVMARLFVRERKMAYNPRPLYFYEAHPGSLSRQGVTPRAFEEFDNVLDVYTYTVSEMPEYQDYALSNAVETAVKLLWASRKSCGTPRRKELVSFLKRHRSAIAACPPLNGKVKGLALAMSLL